MIWIVLAILVVCSGAVSGSETVLFALTRKELQEAGASASGLRRRAHELMRNPRHVLMTVLMTNTAINVAIFSLSFQASGAQPSLHPLVAASIGVGVLLTVILFGEMLPKALALRNAKSLAPYSAALLSSLEAVLSPIQRVLSFFLVDPITRLLAPSRATPSNVSVDELRLLVEHSAREGHIDAAENDMLQAVVGLTEISVREVMTPRVDIEKISLHADIRKTHDVIATTRKRLLPVCGRDLDDVRGILPTRSALLYPDVKITTLIHPPEFVPEQANLAHVMQHFRTARSHLAIVVDEYGGTSGIVTNDNLVARIVGDLPMTEDANERSSTERIDDNNYRVDGNLSVRTWAARFAVGEIDDHIDTVGGLILSKLGRVPHVGDEVHVRNLTLKVESMSRQRIQQVLINRNSQENGSAETAA